jgi:hypothetical protein
MSSVTRKFQVRDGAVVEVTGENPLTAAGSSALPPLFGGGAAAYSDTRPGKSSALSCHSSEIKMMNDRLRQEGITGIHYEPQYKHSTGELIGGRCVITSNSKRTGRRRWMKVYGEMCGIPGLHDEDSFD